MKPRRLTCVFLLIFSLFVCLSAGCTEAPNRSASLEPSVHSASAETAEAVCSDASSAFFTDDPQKFSTDVSTDLSTNHPSDVFTDSSSPGSDPAEESSVSSPSQTDGKRSLLGLLQTALQPMGSTMYVWGGGWNEEDTGAGTEAVTIGVSPRWAAFAETQSADYDPQPHRYQIHDGLDCSGYIGWVLYNTLKTEDGQNGYVMKAHKMAKAFSELGFGEYTPKEAVSDWQAGDLLSTDSHVWMAVGMCEDGSVVLMHCASPGVTLAGTLLPDGTESRAVLLARTYMQTYFPAWFAKYPSCTAPYHYLTDASRMRWNRQTLSDGKGLSALSAEEVLQTVFGS